MFTGRFSPTVTNSSKNHLCHNQYLDCMQLLSPMNNHTKLEVLHTESDPDSRQ